jgi:hypothetical protein
VALLVSRAFRPYRAVGWVAVLGVALLAALHGKSYYALGYYPVLFAFGAVWWESRLAQRGQTSESGWKSARRLALVVGLVGFLLAFLPLMFPVRSPAAMAGLRPRYADLGVYRWEDGRDHALPQDYADMLGWHELADKTWAAYQSLPATVRAHALIKCANYGQASAINYYNRGRALPPATSFNGSFLFWFVLPPRCQAPIIVDDELHQELAPHFAAYRQFAAVANPYARERGTAVIIRLRPDSTVRALVRQEHRAALAEWEGPAQP